MGRNGYVVAHLVRIGEGDKESLGFYGMVGHDKCVVLLFQREEIPNDIFEVCVESSMRVSTIVGSDLGVVACSSNADEGAVVDVDGVYLAPFVSVYEFQCLDRI